MRGGVGGEKMGQKALLVSPGLELSAQGKLQVCVKKGIWRPGQTWSGWQVAGST